MKFAIKKSNKKRYVILREKLGASWMICDSDPVTFRNIPGTEHEGNPNVGKEMVDYQAINPKTGEAWQAIRHGLKSEFIFEEVAQ